MPGFQAERTGATHLRRQVGRDAQGLLEVVPRDADQARLERLRVEPLLDRPQLVEQPPELRVDELLVRDPADGREHLGPRVGAGRRHLRALIPEEQAARLVEIGDLRQAEAELLEGPVGAHIEKSLRRTAAWGDRTPVRASGRSGAGSARAPSRRRA